MSPKKHPIAEDWYHLAFDALYPIVYGHRTLEAANPESQFSIEQTGLTADDRVLDLACGGGRHIAHLLKVCPHVTGLDYSPQMLDTALETLGAEARLVRADMRRQPFENAFDVVMNYFTSFGYFQTREENLAVAHGIAASLRNGGRFFIDYLNRTWAETNLQTRTRREVQGFEIRELRWIDTERHRVNKATIVSKNGRELKGADESVQLYTEREFVDLLSEGGLVVDRLFGNYDGSPLRDNQPRMIAVGHKA